MDGIDDKIDIVVSDNQDVSGFVYEAYYFDKLMFSLMNKDGILVLDLHRNIQNSDALIDVVPLNIAKRAIELLVLEYQDDDKRGNNS